MGGWGWFVFRLLGPSFLPCIGGRLPCVGELHHTSAENPGSIGGRSTSSPGLEKTRGPCSVRSTRFFSANLPVLVPRPRSSARLLRSMSSYPLHCRVLVDGPRDERNGGQPRRPTTITNTTLSAGGTSQAYYGMPIAACLQPVQPFSFFRLHHLQL